MCANDRNIERRVVRSVSDDSEDDDDIAKMTVVQLNDVCKTYGLPRSGNKPELLLRLIPFLTALNTVDDDDSDGMDDED